MSNENINREQTAMNRLEWWLNTHICEILYIAENTLIFKHIVYYYISYTKIFSHWTCRPGKYRWTLNCEIHVLFNISGDQRIGTTRLSEVYLEFYTDRRPA